MTIISRSNFATVTPIITDFICGVRNNLTPREDMKFTLSDLKDWLAQETADVLPIGFTYFQLPGKSSPITLGLEGTWQNISSTFAGNFFRVEGGLASTFESGTQIDASQRITGELLFNTQGFDSPNANGAFSGTNTVANSPNYFTAQADPGSLNPKHIAFDSKDSTSPNPAKTDDFETRPINETIRIWERVL